MSLRLFSRIRHGGRWLGQRGRRAGAPAEGFAWKIGSQISDDDGAQLPRLGGISGCSKLAGVKGIFHGRTSGLRHHSEEVAGLRKAMNLAEDDAYVLCCAPQWQATLAGGRPHRARLAWHRIPQEVRNVVVKKGAPEDGTTSPMRPLLDVLECTLKPMFLLKCSARCVAGCPRLASNVGR